MRAPRLGWVLVGAALVAFAAAVVLALGPLSGRGLSGSAASPVYGEYSFVVVGDVSATPSPDELRAAGVVLPEDVVAERRRLALGAGAVSALLAVAGVVAAARPRRA